MRAITLRQPWAWGVIEAEKDVENRTTDITGSRKKYRGTVAIHVSQRGDLVSGLAGSAGTMFDAQLLAASKGADWANPPWWKNVGMIIGVVDIVDVHYASEPQYGLTCGGIDNSYGDALCSPWAEPDRFHLVLANARPLTEPLPYKGGLGLRKLTPNQIAAVLERLP